MDREKLAQEAICNTRTALAELERYQEAWENGDIILPVAQREDYSQLIIMARGDLLKFAARLGAVLTLLQAQFPHIHRS